MSDKWNSFKKKKYSYLICYTVMFVIVSSLTLFRFAAYHKTIIWYHDGLKQHYNALLYYGRYLRQIAGTLINEHRFELPMWDFTIGYGSDIITTFHYYAVGDPLALLSALVPERFCQYFYCMLYLLRLYLAGLSFSIFALWHKRSRFSTLIGAFIYIFSAYSLILGLMHPFFVSPLIWFPMILLGIDKIIKKESPLVFIIFTSIAAMSNFYFFYVEIVLAILYAVYRYFCVYKRFDLKGFLSLLAKFLLYGLNAFLISAVILLPVLSVTLSSKRLAASEASSVDIVNHADFYLKYLAGFTNSVNPGMWTLMGYTALGLISVVFMAVKHKEYKKYLVLFAVLTLMVFLPAAGYALNGCLYVVNRWIWAYAMAVGYITAKVIEDFASADYADRRKTALIITLYCVVYALFEVSRSEQSMASAAVLLTLAFLIIFVDINKISIFKYRSVIVAVLLFGLASNAYYKMSIHANDGWLDEFLDSHEADKKLKEENADALLEGKADGDFYRIEEVGIDTTLNSSIQRGVHGTQYYHSMTNSCISDFIDMMYMNWPNDFNYEGLESRSILEALASVKYFFVGEGGEAERPYNYSKLLVSGNSALGQVSVYEADTALPLGYTYSGYVPVEKFEKMNVVERADAMLGGAVMEESSFPEADINSDAEDVTESIEGKGRINVSDNEFFVRGSGTVRIKFNALADSETYIVFDNLKYRSVSERESYDDGEWANLTQYEKNKVFAKDIYGHEDVSSSLQVTCGDFSKIVSILSPGADFYCGRSNFLVNLGYHEEAPDELTISFRSPGYYSFDSLRVISKPVAGISKGIGKLAEDVMTDTVIDTNSVSGKISLDEDKILLLTIPYSDGWTAYVDGNKADIRRANIMYMALELAKGEHDIELKYETPMIRMGSMMSLTGLCLLIVLAIADFYRRKVLKRKGNYVE